MHTEHSAEFLQYMRVNHIRILPHCSTVREAFEATLRESAAYPVVNDLGPQHLEETLDLIDYMVLTVYRGQLDQRFVGQQMPKWSTVLTLFDVVYTSEEIPQHLGSIRFVVFVRKGAEQWQ